MKGPKRITAAMDTHQLPHFLRTTLLIALLFLLLCSRSWSGSTNPVTKVIKADDTKVKLELYYESLCPYCSRFIVNHLNKLFETGIIDITDLYLIPYGNAKLKPNNTIVCQHGPYEWLLNTVEACAIDVWPLVDEYFPFIYCVETLVIKGKYTQWETCFQTRGLDPKPVTACYTSGHGLELDLKYAAETNALQPCHKYVPWVVVNGQPLYEDYEEFLSYICNAYEGNAVPSACHELSTSLIQESKPSLIKPVCYKEVKEKIAGTGAATVSWINQLISYA